MSSKNELVTTGEKKPKRKRPDKTEQMSVHTEPGDNSKYLLHSMALYDMPDVDRNDPEAVNSRIREYFMLCAENDMKPSVADLALAFGVHRKTLWAWANEVDSKTLPTACRNSIKKAYQLLNSQMENYMQNGKINPVAGIFLMKNNMGYQDKQEVVLTPNSQMGDSATPEELHQRYIEATAGDYVED